MKLMAEEQKIFLTGLGASAKRGGVGEAIIKNVVAGMNLGYYEDTSKSQALGTADGVWKLKFPSHQKLPSIRCLVEAKYSDSMGGKDYDKFDKNVADALTQGSINCAMLISLKSQIDSTSDIIDIKLERGIAVIRASRMNDDPMSQSELIKLAFRTMSQLWPVIQNKHVAAADTIELIQNVASFLNTMLDDIRSIEKEIQFLVKTSTQLHRQSVNLER